MLLAHISIASIAFHAVSMIYFLCGIHSSHIFWVIGIIIFSYSISDMKGGLFWFLVMACVLCTFIYFEKTNYPLPIFQLTPRQALVDLLSGYILPTVVIGLGMAFLLKLRNTTFAEAEEALEEATKQTKTSSHLTEQLINILQQASISANTLLSSADELSGATKLMNNSCDDITDGIDEQLKATHIVNTTLQTMASGVLETNAWYAEN